MAITAASSPLTTTVSDAISRTQGNQNTTVTKTRNDILGKDDFLKILISQMKNQDPTSPMQDKEFIAQMAQFTSVEQMTNLAQSQTSMLNEIKMMRQSLGGLSNMIGKQVYWLDDASQMQNGLVKAVSSKDGNMSLVVNGKSVAIDKVEFVTQPEGFGP